MDRKGLKNWAKRAFYRSYWKSVLVGFLLTIVAGAGASSSSSGSSSSSSSSDLAYMTEEEMAVFVGILLVVLAIGFVISAVAILIKVFLFNPLQIGCQAYFCDGLYNTEPQLNLLGKGFKSNYKNIIKTMFLKDLYLWLWSLIMLIPMAMMIVAMYFYIAGADNTVSLVITAICLIGFIFGIIPSMVLYLMKFYEYMLIPYILAENPDMSTKQVFALTKKMMTGDKWDAFVLQLSFIGWNMLSLLTCGVLSIFYVEPYRYYTLAGFYKAMQQKVQYLTGSETREV